MKMAIEVFQNEASLYNKGLRQQFPSGYGGCPSEVNRPALALARCREKQNELAQKLLRELREQYPDKEIFASEYAKAMALCTPAALVR